MPAGDEEGICSTHHTRITREGTACRDNFAFRSKSLARLPGGRGAQRAHAWCQPHAGRAYSARGQPRSAEPRSGRPRSGRPRSGRAGSGRPGSGRPGSGQPCRTQLSERAPRRGSGSAERGRCWQSHQVPPGQSSWCWRRQGRQTMDIVWPAAASAAAGQCARCYLLRGLPGEPGQDQPGQAALARRIRRRRSEARSSSFRPPHVPYFSGREIA